MRISIPVRITLSYQLEKRTPPKKNGCFAAKTNMICPFLFVDGIRLLVE